MSAQKYPHQANIDRLLACMYALAQGIGRAPSRRDRLPGNRTTQPCRAHPYGSEVSMRALSAA